MAINMYKTHVKLIATKTLHPLRLTANDVSDKGFLLTPKFCHKGVICPCLEANVFAKISWKILKKIRVESDPPKIYNK